MLRTAKKIWSLLGHLFLLGDVIAFLTGKGLAATVIVVAGGVAVDWISDNTPFLIYALLSPVVMIVGFRWDEIAHGIKGYRRRREIAAQERRNKAAREVKRLNRLEWGELFTRKTTLPSLSDIKKGKDDKPANDDEHKCNRC